MRLSEYVESARRFVWNELADWYVEAAKHRVSAEGPDRDVARAVLVHVFDQALRLLHPVVPFVTEALWQRLPARTSGEYLARARVAGRRCAARAARAIRDRARSGERDQAGARRVQRAAGQDDRGGTDRARCAGASAVLAG